MIGVASMVWTSPSGADAPAVVTPPPSIASDCSKDVSQHMQQWLGKQPAGTIVNAPAGSCYLIDEGLRITGVQNLTISGGTWRDAGTPAPGASPSGMGAAFWLVGGSNVTLENLTVVGVNPGGYVYAGAFAAGIRSDGVVGLTVSNVVVSHVYGDGIELGPLRGANDLAGTIVNPTENATITNIHIDGAGRQGVTLSSVTSASISSVQLQKIGLNAFDVEADQWDEGALNVTINGCTVGGSVGGLFFANGGESAGRAYTGNIIVENCTMSTPLAGDAILVKPPVLESHPRGPFTFADDYLYCGSSVYVACLESTDAQVSVVDSTLRMLPGTIHEPVYRVNKESAVSFIGDTVTGFGSVGSVDPTSSVVTTGGAWTPYGTISTPSTVAIGSVPASGTNSPGAPAHLSDLVTSSAAAARWKPSATHRPVVAAPTGARVVRPHDLVVVGVGMGIMSLLLVLAGVAKRRHRRAPRASANTSTTIDLLTYTLPPARLTVRPATRPTLGNRQELTPAAPTPLR